MAFKQTENRRKAPHSAWKPGQTGNPKGRPRLGNSVSEVARKVLETKKRGDTMTRGEKILAKAAQLAEAGSKPHMEFLFDRAYGKALESMNLSGGLSLYEQGASEQNFDKTVLLEAMRRLSGNKK